MIMGYAERKNGATYEERKAKAIARDEENRKVVQEVQVVRGRKQGRSNILELYMMMIMAGKK